MALNGINCWEKGNRGGKRDSDKTRTNRPREKRGKKAKNCTRRGMWRMETPFYQKKEKEIGGCRKQHTCEGEDSKGVSKSAEKQMKKKKIRKKQDQKKKERKKKKKERKKGKFGWKIRSPADMNAQPGCKKRCWGIESCRKFSDAFLKKGKGRQNTHKYRPVDHQKMGTSGRPLRTE